jgi:hypothetical protein
VVGGSRFSKPARVVSAIVVIGLGVACLGSLAQFAAIQVTDHSGHFTSVADRVKAVGDARTSFIQLVGAAGFAGGLLYTARTFALSRGTQQADRFVKAIEQTGNDTSEAVRAGGIYSLWLLAQESEAYWPAVETALCAYVRENAKPGLPALAPDVQIAVMVLGQRPYRAAGTRGSALDLRDAILNGSSLPRANLESVWLENACLDGADLTDAHLVRARLKGASLKDASLMSADLTEADLTSAVLRGANLYRTNFANAIFKSTDLTGCDLTGARNLTSRQLAGVIGVYGAPP